MVTQYCVGTCVRRVFRPEKQGASRFFKNLYMRGLCRRQ